MESRKIICGKKITFIIVMIALTGISILHAQDVRGVSWGMSMEEVIKIEGNDWDQRDIDSLLYWRQLLRTKSSLLYNFHSNKLVEVFYMIDGDIFERLRLAINEKYKIEARPFVPNSYAKWTYGYIIIELRTCTSYSEDFKGKGTLLFYTNKEPFLKAQQNGVKKDAKEL